MKPNRYALSSIVALLTGTASPPLVAGQAASPLVREHSAADPLAEVELATGTALTRTGSFSEAIPHLLAARGHVANEYAAGFNLALCYVGTRQPQQAVAILNDLRSANHDNADVNNLLAQAYVAAGADQNAFEALQRAAALTPNNEKLYMFVADACIDRQAYELGIRVVDLALKNLPDSARLHFERAMFLSLLDQFDRAKPDFDLAQKLAPNSDVAYDAAAQQAMLAGDVPRAISVAREAVVKRQQDFTLLTLLGEALLRSGAIPGQPEFEEAKQALQKSIELRPNYASSQVALGKLLLLGGRAADAITHLEIARQLSPRDPAVYSQLAAAYRKQGDLQKAQDALSTLANLNEAKAEKIREAPGDRSGYASTEQPR